MKFSILIPVYNVEKHLPQCLDSVLAQTYSDFEVVLVDDGSTDSCAEICDEYAANDSRFKVIHKENQGLISARRVGIANASGEFCVFVDSDDFIEPDLLEVVASYLDDSVDMAIYSFRYFEKGSFRERKTDLFPDGTVFEGESKKELYERFIVSNDVTAIWLKAIRTSVIKSDPTDYEQYYRFNMSEDILQSLYPLTASQKIVYAKKELYNYRINESSVSRSFRVETIPSKSTIHVYNAICEYLPKWGLDDEDTILKLNAKWFNTILYTFCKYCENARNQKEIIDFEWDLLIPSKARSTDNSYNAEVYVKLYEWIKDKNYLRISFYFKKKKIYKKLRETF